MIDENFMTLDEVAIYLRLSKTTVYRLTQKGKIPAFKIASQWRYKKDLVDAWIMKKPKYKKSKARI